MPNARYELVWKILTWVVLKSNHLSAESGAPTTVSNVSHTAIAHPPDNNQEVTSQNRKETLTLKNVFASSLKIFEILLA